MSGGGGGVIIIHSLINSGKIGADDVKVLNQIADRSVTRCSVSDAWKVCRILWKYLRTP